MLEAHEGNSCAQLIIALSPEFCFLCRIFYWIINNNNADLMKEMKHMTKAQKQDTDIKHALQLHAAVELSDYDSFFSLYSSTRHLGKCLAKHLKSRMRSKALRCVVFLWAFLCQCTCVCVFLRHIRQQIFLGRCQRSRSKVMALGRVACGLNDAAFVYIGVFMYFCLFVYICLRARTFWGSTCTCMSLTCREWCDSDWCIVWSGVLSARTCLHRCEMTLW